MSAHRTAPRSAPEADEIPPPPRSAPDRAPQPAPHPTDTATDVVRWAAFSCVLVPVVLVWYGTSLAGAAGAALGLAAVTGACRVLLRQSERGAARRTAAHATVTRATPARRTAARSMAEDRTPRRGRRGRSSSGAHRGGRNSGPSTPVD
ncbi:hypothetical protein PV729_08520 [Streptomyces europaeiscabiei]|uniref:Integral membrane protein n=1 Tax=Streptomyces europaeiscabiei TaxID=146819 RepID=A0ABU4NBW7_9ACTN|nr:hypothetical protein [Streptomyces europaeiscabiei]MDX3541476.1 hypothetical protein [Streptomyces europaeiscabiei]MDX3551817.1 hypothetical protein [Streptomyces europaeiscabiei]MDX3700056.1 hypothetical protein [Streptomyces europaeiscabiei]